MFHFLGRFTVAHAGKVCAAWLAVGVVLTWAAPNWDTSTQDDDITFLPERCASVRGYQLLARAFPQDVFASRAIFALQRPDARLTEADFALVDRLSAELARLSRDEPDLHIGKVCSFRDPLVGKRLISADGQCTLIQASLGTPFLALQTSKTMNRAEHRLREVLAEGGPDTPRLLVTGPAGVGRDLIHAANGGLEATTVATVLLVVVVLLAVYRAPLLALVPLVTIAVSVWVSLSILALTTRIPGLYLVNVSKVFAIVVLYGAGTDYCLFLISRYREELAAGYDLPTAIRRSLTSVGGALVASAGTVVCGLGMMGFAEFAKVRCAGPAIGLSLGVALLASLTLTPALLHLLGRFVFWPGRLPAHEARPAREDVWGRISRGVVARPALVWAVSVLLLLPLAVLGFCVQPNYKETAELPPSSGSVQGVEAIQRHFTAGEIGPITVLLASPADWNSPDGRAIIAHLSRGFTRLDNVAEVRSLTHPLGEYLPEPGMKPEPARRGLLGVLARSVHRNVDGFLEQAQHAARHVYVAAVPAEGGTGQEYVTRLDVVLHSDPWDARSLGTLGLIQTWLREELPRSTGRIGVVQSECYGVTVNSHDLAQVTESDRMRVNALVLAGILAILVVLVRRPWLAGYLLLTVLFSYYATLGATTLLGTLVNGQGLGQVEWRVPFFLFTILVAVGEDYNILLMSRVLQERRRHGDEEGTRRALARTGGTITSCGVIMAGTFATLMLTGLGTMMQIGFALAFGVLLDTFVVRPFLVPAFTLLVWRLKRDGKPEPVTLRLYREPAPSMRRAA